jgi:hypothetical protein
MKVPLGSHAHLPSLWRAPTRSFVIQHVRFPLATTPQCILFPFIFRPSPLGGILSFLLVQTVLGELPIHCFHRSARSFIYWASPTFCLPLPNSICPPSAFTWSIPRISFSLVCLCTSWPALAGTLQKGSH